MIPSMVQEYWRRYQWMHLIKGPYVELTYFHFCQLEQALDS